MLRLGGRSIGRLAERQRVPRAFSTASSTGAAWHVAIVGSGPAAYYTADQLLKNDPNVRVDLYERLPVPFGLVRYGVAPDHQTVKNVTERFDQISSDPRCSLLCNVRIGEGEDPAGHAASLSLQSLREHYNAVVLAYGADTDRTLGIPGEDLHGVHAAREFVEWYNGHPAAAVAQDAMSGDGGGFARLLASSETAVVVGHGNVALDCARMLCSTADQLVGETDVAEHAAAAIADSSVRRVVLLGRRGVLHAAFTIKELRELSRRAGATTHLVAPADAFGEVVMAEAAKERPRKRLIELMQTLHTPEMDEPGGSGRGAADGLAPSGGSRELRVQFQRVPTAFLGDEGGCVRAVRVACTELIGPPSAQQQASAIEGSEYELSCGLALRAVGYRSSPMLGAPFDERRGVIPSRDGGRVVDDDASGSTGPPGPTTSGLYVTGWLKRGPSGVILTNVGCANETAAALLADRQAGELACGGGGGDAVRQMLRGSGGGRPVLDYDSWRRIDALEIERGKQRGKVREKVVSVEEMLEIGAGA